MIASSSIVQSRTPSWRTVLGLGIRGFLAVLLFIASTMVASGLSGGPQAAKTANPAQALAGLGAMGILFAVALSYPVIRSKWTGWKAVAAMISRCRPGCRSSRSVGASSGR